MKSIVMKNHYPNPCGGLTEVDVSDEVYELLMQFRREWQKIKRQDRRHGICRYEEGISEWAMCSPLPITEDVVLQRDFHASLKKRLTKPQYRRLYAHVYRGYNITEIARMEGVMRSAVTKSIDAAKDKLKNTL